MALLEAADNGQVVSQAQEPKESERVASTIFLVDPWEMARDPRCKLAIMTFWQGVTVST